MVLHHRLRGLRHDLVSSHLAAEVLDALLHQQVLDVLQRVVVLLLGDVLLQLQQLLLEVWLLLWLRVLHGHLLLQELLLHAVQVLDLLLRRHVLDALQKTLVQDLVVDLRELSACVLHFHVCVHSCWVLLGIRSLEGKGRLPLVARTCGTPVSKRVDCVATRVLRGVLVVGSALACPWLAATANRRVATDRQI